MKVQDRFSLENKVALVTGAAYGIGFAIAEAYAEAGAKIAFNCRSREHMDKALKDYADRGIDAKGYLCDVTDEEQVREMVDDITDKMGDIDILVNNAGIIKRIPMIEMDVEEFRKVVDIDLNAAFIVSKAVLPDALSQSGQDHQYLLHDERTWKRDSLCICGGKGRLEDAYQEHRFRIWRLQYPVQRHRPRVYRKRLRPLLFGRLSRTDPGIRLIGSS